jgi:hypothetical protein
MTGDLSEYFRRPTGGMTYDPEVGPKQSYYRPKK